MDASVLRKRIYKLLIFSILMVLGILLMAFLFINHADDSLNKATYTTMDQEIDLCTTCFFKKEYRLSFIEYFRKKFK